MTCGESSPVKRRVENGLRRTPDGPAADSVSGPLLAPSSGSSALNARSAHASRARADMSVPLRMRNANGCSRTRWRSSIRTFRSGCRADSTIRPSRPVVGRPIAVCYEVTASGELADRRRVRPVHRRRADGRRDIRQPEFRLQWRGPLRGHQRESAEQRRRPGGVVHRRVRPPWADLPFPGSIRQRLAKMDN